MTQPRRSLASLALALAASFALFACKADSNGAGGGPMCPTGTHALGDLCVDCLADADCPLGRTCGAGHSCDAGCTAAHGCDGSQVCDTASSTCVQCVAATDCMMSGLSQCDTGQHRCVACLANPDCAGDAMHPVCDPVAHACVGCASSTDCPLGQLCSKQSTCAPGCNGGHGCPSGQQCDPQSGQCVACIDDAACSGMTPRCDPKSHQCVACVGGPGDNCPSGQYCRTDDTCERGCKTDKDCPAGATCQPDHSCSTCKQDSDCVAGDICQSGTCAPGCGTANPCGGSSTCCGLRCQDLMSDALNCGSCGHACASGESCCGGQCATLDSVQHCGACGTVCATGQACCGGACVALSTPTNCGACGNACSAGDFCDGKACQTPTYPNFCKNKTVYAIYDGFTNDNAATDLMASTIKANCPSGTTVTFVQQTDATKVDQTTGEPLAGGGVTYVLAGGPFASKVVKWSELTEKVTKIYFSAPNGVDFDWIRRSDGATVATMPGAACDGHHDQFISELVADPKNGTLSLIGYGACAGGLGTKGSGWYYANVMLPMAMSYPDSWYIVGWTDTNGDGTPNQGDAFAILAHGM